MNPKIETRNGTGSSMIYVGEGETSRDASKVRRKSSFERKEMQTPRTAMQLRVKPTPDWLAKLQGTKQLQKRSATPLKISPATPTISSRTSSKDLDNKADDVTHPAQMVSSDETSSENLTPSNQIPDSSEKPGQTRLASTKKPDHLSHFFSWPTGETLASFFDLIARLPQVFGLKHRNNQPSKLSGRNIDITADEIALNNIDIPYDVTRTPLHNPVSHTQDGILT